MTKKKNTTKKKGDAPPQASPSEKKSLQKKAIEPVQTPPVITSAKSRRDDEKVVKKQRNEYSQAVYTSRFMHFRILHISSWFIGVIISISLVFGLWRLYQTVFDTIAQTENLFFVQETKRTDIINFSVLEDVRAAWHEKYDMITTTTPAAIFGVVPPPIDTEAQRVEE